MKRFLSTLLALLLPLSGQAQLPIPATLLSTGFVSLQWNASDKNANITLSAGDRTGTSAGANTTWYSARGTTSHASGKQYLEVIATTAVGGVMIGVATSSASIADNNYIGNDASGWGYLSADGQKYNNATPAAFGATYGAGVVIGIAIDIDAGKLWWAKNNVWQASGNPATGANPAYTGVTGTLFPAASAFNTSDAFTFPSANTYAPPSGFSTW
jgi:hypothetical protein